MTGPLGAGLVEQLGGPVHVVGAEHHVDVRRPLPHQVAVLLGEAAGHHDLEAGALRLERLQVAEGAVQLVVGVLPDAAGVEDDDVRVLGTLGLGQPVGLEEAGDAQRVVLVHLAPEGADGVGAGLHGGAESTERRPGASAARATHRPMDSLEVTAPAFVEMAHRIVWATVATVDEEDRPRSRVLHPLWYWDGTSLVGWVATGPTPTKRAHLAPQPATSRWATGRPTTTPAPRSARATLVTDDDTRVWLWEAFVKAPAPVGYDPAIIPPWAAGPTSDAFAALRLDPWRLRVMPGTVMTAGQGVGPHLEGMTAQPMRWDPGMRCWRSSTSRRMAVRASPSISMSAKWARTRARPGPRRGSPGRWRRPSRPG